MASTTPAHSRGSADGRSIEVNGSAHEREGVVGPGSTDVQRRQGIHALDDNEQLTVEIQNLSLHDQKAPFTLEERLSTALLSSGLMPSQQARVKTLCGLVERAGSSVVGTSYSGLEKPLRSLLPCVDVAIKAKNDSLNGPPHGELNPPRRIAIPGAEPEDTEVCPSVLIIVRESTDVYVTLSRLHGLLADARIPLLCVGIDGMGLLPVADSRRQYENVDIAVCSSSGTRCLIEHKHTYDLDRLRLVFWEDAHHMFGPDFRNGPDFKKHRSTESPLYSMAPKLVHRHNVRFVLEAPAEHVSSLSAIKRTVLRTDGETRVLDFDGLGRCLERAAIVQQRQALREQDSGSCGHNQLEIPNEHPISFLFRLPGGIRNRIYHYSVPASCAIRLTMFRPAGDDRPCRAVGERFADVFHHEGHVFDHVEGKWKDTLPSTTFALSRVNEQLAVETLPIHYADNIFEFSSIGCMNIFLTSIGSLARHVRHIKIIEGQGFAYTKKFTTFQKLAPLLELESLSIDFLSFARGDRHQRVKIRVDEFAHEIKGYLLNWHEAHKDASSSSSVLDFTKVTHTCRRCHKNQEDDGSTCNGTSHPCAGIGSRARYAECRNSVKCGRRCQVRRMRKVRQEVRECIAEVLGMAD